MGIWDAVRREVGRLVSQGGAASKPKKRSTQRETPEGERGPDPGTLLTPEDIEAATGSRPVGEGDRRSGGMDVDTGYLRVCIWTLGDGGQLLLNVNRFQDREQEALFRSRWDDPSWKNTDDEKPLEGLGELAKWYVTKAPKGGMELHVTAQEGRYKSQLVHTSRSGSEDITPLVELMRTVLARLARD